MSLILRPIMNSAVEDIFAFKSCCGLRVFDQNLEIQVTNQGADPVRVPSYFDLTDGTGFHRVETLMPHGVLSLEPGETGAFYCSMDEERWKSAKEMILYDVAGNRYGLKLG